MKVLLIAGFLGSGKTTLLLEIARRVVNNSYRYRVAIIENDIGEIGIDGKYLRQEGLDLEIQELFGGCICCTISVNLVTTFEKVTLLQPDLIIIEPTGLANPGDVVSILRRNFPKLSDIIVLVLVDATRYEIISKILAPLLTVQIQEADVIAINKIDEVNMAKVELVSRSVRQLNSQAKVMVISARKLTNIDTLLGKIL